ncbi:AAA family ATPase [Actinoallomurus soli]|uniref:AAA family ATPase n=1 Tax=Actinoallomurus soli TaxID=2952535 RepID=UPI002092C6CD|nr:AAA family ATPase [Actinoallomurus soli]MCO5973223.1 AAA family ATPase [Actinoallomurus soli]
MVEVTEPGPDVRKSVAVLFIDLVDSTVLGERFDPELLHGVLRRYYGVCGDAVTAYGGVIEKFIGDAVMAVFGLPVSHEDDALRAAQAAMSIVEAVPRLAAELQLPGLGLKVHCGVASGEVAVISGPGVDLRIVGDTVNTAARLQSAAPPGEVLINAEAAHLVRGRIGLEELGPLSLKGKAEPARVWRATAAAPEQALVRAPLIGRSAELASLTACYRQVVADRECRHVLVVGEPGMGKTRLVQEFLARIPPDEAVVLTGSCQPYGRDITFHPLQSMLRDSLPGGLPSVERLLGEDERARRTLSAVAGEDPGRLPAGVEEIRWAVVRLFTALAERRPLILVWEELQWAEPMLAALIENLTGDLAGLPILVVRVARDEPPSSTGRTIRLGPLDPADTSTLVGALSSGLAEVTAQQERPVMAGIAERSGGNPLFATMLIGALADGDPAMAAYGDPGTLADGDPAAPELPPTISALLRARIDALPAAEKRTLQWAAACGRDFDLDQLRALGGEDGAPDGDVARPLAGLTRRGLVHRLPSGRLQCAQVLIRDTCYGMTAKTLRARWHALLSDRAGPPGEAMYHAERSALLYRDVGPDDPRLAALSDRAVRLLVAEGTTALHRRDTGASRSLFERALRLLTEHGRRYADVTIRLSEALLARGDGEGALRVLDEGARRVDAAHRITVGLQRDIVGFRLGRTGFDAARASLDRYEADLRDRPDDHLNRCLLHQFRGFVELSADRVGRAEAAFRDALDRARRLDEPWIADRLSSALCELVQWSPTTVAEGLTLCDELCRRFAADRLLLIPVLTTRARLLALAGDVAGARATLASAREDASAMHAALPEIAISQSEAVLLSLVGEHTAAGGRFAEAAGMLRGQGHLQPALTLQVYAAREMLRAGREEAAARAIAELEENELVARARIWLRLLRARLACAAGRAGEGFHRARWALDALETDDPCLRGDAWFEYAVISRAAGRTEEAAWAVAEAETCYTAKGANLPAGAARRWAAATMGGEA